MPEPYVTSFTTRLSVSQTHQPYADEIEPVGASSLTGLVDAQNLNDTLFATGPLYNHQSGDQPEVCSLDIMPPKGRHLAQTGTLSRPTIQIILYRSTSAKKTQTGDKSPIYDCPFDIPNYVAVQRRPLPPARSSLTAKRFTGAKLLTQTNPALLSITPNQSLADFSSPCSISPDSSVSAFVTG